MWKNAFMDSNMILKLDDAGEVIAAVIFAGRGKWCAVDADGAVIGYANSATAAMALVG